MGYLKDTIKGVSWMGILRASTRGIAYLRIAILARLLSPEQFGIFGIASLTLAFLEILTETGVNIFLIQCRADIKEYLDTVWVVSILRGILISLVIILFAPTIASFFNTQGSYQLLLIVSVAPLLRGFINPAIVKFQKELQFKKEFLFRLTIFSFDAFVTVVFAFINRSAISLVWGLIAGVILELLISHLIIRPKPNFSFQLNKLRRVMGKGKWIMISGLFNYLFHQGDDVVVGKILQLNSLGLYQIAYKISTLPIFEVGEVFNKVTFPIYTKISADKKRLKKAFVKMTIVTSLLVIPFGAILYFFPTQIIKIILGEKWLAMVPVFKILSIFGIVRAISGSSSALFLGLKKQKYIAFVTLTSVLVLAISIFPLVNKFGIVGAGISALAGSIAAVPVILYFLYKVFK